MADSKTLHPNSMITGSPQLVGLICNKRRILNSVFSDKGQLEPVIRSNLEQSIIDTTDDEAKRIVSELNGLQDRILHDRQNEVTLGERIIALKRRLDEIHMEKAR